MNELQRVLIGFPHQFELMSLAACTASDTIRFAVTMYRIKQKRGMTGYPNNNKNYRKDEQGKIHTKKNISKPSSATI